MEKKWLWSKRRFLGILILLVVLYFGYTKHFESTASTTQRQTATVSKGTIVSSVSASGTVLSSNILPITTSAAGIVRQVFAKDGDMVKKGQKIAEVELDPAGAQNNASDYAQYLSSKNNLDSAKNDLNTLQASMFAANQKFINDAVERNLPTNDPTYIQENATWLAAQAKYREQAQVISQSQIAVGSAFINYQNSSNIVYATNTGIIQNITIVPGMTLSYTSGSTNSSSAANGKRVAVIETKGTPLATFNVSEVDVSKITQGLKATITLDSLDNKTFTGKVISVDKIGSTTSNVTTYPVIIQFDTEASEVLPNMTATASIILETKDNVLLVPNSAITSANGQSTALIMKNSKEQTVSIQTGLTSDTETEILSGLSEGDTVVTGTTAASTTSGSSTRSVFSGFGGGGARFVGR